MHKNATKCNETLNKWCKNKHGASKIMDTLETYHPTGRLNLGFLLREKLAAVLIIPSSWGSQLDGDLHHHHHAKQRFFWRRFRGERRLLQGEFRTHILYFVLVLLYFIFLLASFLSTPKLE
jgi:hypothetical protein